MTNVKADYSSGTALISGTNGVSSAGGVNPMAFRINQSIAGGFGDGTDGAFSSSSGTTNLTRGRIYQYTSFSLTGTGTITATAGDSGLPVIIMVQGNCTISSSGTSINLAGAGSQGGTGGTTTGFYGGASACNHIAFPAGFFRKGIALATTSAANDARQSPYPFYYLHGGGAGIGTDPSTRGGGGGGAGAGANGTVGTGGDPGAAGTGNRFSTVGKMRQLATYVGGGGGQGGANTGSTGGVGGNGGGTLILLVGGDFTFSGTISVAGSNGSAGSGGGAGGGGGGGGGLILVLVDGTISDSGTKTVTGGTGAVGDSANGGNGGVGLAIVQASSGFQM